MKNRVFYYALLTLLLKGFNTFAQQATEIKGNPYTENQRNKVDGTPYLFVDWFPGSVQLADGKSIDMKLNYDLVTDKLLFKNPKDSRAMLFIDPIKSFTFKVYTIGRSDLIPAIFYSGYPPAGRQDSHSYYQLIADGKLTLLKRYQKVIEKATSNPESAGKQFVLHQFYYLLSGSKLSIFEPNYQTISGLFANHSKEIQDYLMYNRVDFKSDRDLARLFFYYNSL